MDAKIPLEIGLGIRRLGLQPWATYCTWGFRVGTVCVCVFDFYNKVNLFVCNCYFLNKVTRHQPFCYFLELSFVYIPVDFLCGEPL